MKRLPCVIGLVLFVALGCALIQSIGFAQDEGGETKAKHTIKEVMKQAHKDGLLKKVTSGDASAEEQRELLDLYISLVENKPPTGEMDSWHRLAGGAALAAAKIVVGRDGAVVELKEASNCKACHSAHKPPSN